ncbi:MAG: 6-bladed beta-propeller [Candidatus Aminicenantes bacterium]|nr:6-bladed beta-propeller [Candidatus Aminicenantes bacterium]
MTAHQKFLFAASAFIATVFAAGLAAAFDSAQYKNASSARLVANPEKPKSGVVTPKLTEIWSAGEENDASGIVLNQPFQVRVAADGTVFILDWGDTCIKVVDENGKFVRQIGRKGQGPGDLDTPAWFDVDAAGNIFLADSRNMRVSRFDREGNYISSYRMEKFSSEIRVDKSGRLFLEETGRGDTELTSEFTKIQNTFSLVRSEKDGKNPVRIGPFQAEVTLMLRRGDSVVSAGSPNSPMTGWGVDPNGRIWAGYNGTYEIGVYDAEGKPLFRFNREFKPLKSKSFAKLDLAGQKATTLSEHLPAFVQDFFFDDAGNAWFRLFRNEPDEKDEKAKNEPYLYDVFSPEGVYLKQVIIPFRLSQVRKDRMYAIVETEEGFRVLKCYRFE